MKSILRFLLVLSWKVLPQAVQRKLVYTACGHRYAQLVLQARRHYDSKK